MSFDQYHFHMVLRQQEVIRSDRLAADEQAARLAEVLSGLWRALRRLVRRQVPMLRRGGLDEVPAADLSRSVDRGEPEEKANAGAWVAETEGRGVRIMGSQLGPAQAATSVRVRDGDLQLTAGPLAEAREQMAGFDLIDCADRDQASEVASTHPVARFGTVELRQD